MRIARTNPLSGAKEGCKMSEHTPDLLTAHDYLKRDRMRKAAPDLKEQLEAALQELGRIYVGALQGDYGYVDRAAQSATIDFPNGEPTVHCAILAKIDGPK